jgi:predicted negative regulator of RcsB-dependent stress response
MELKPEGRFSGKTDHFRLAFCTFGRMICPSMKSEGADVSTRSIEWLAWVEVHKKQLVVGALVVSILCGGVVIQRWHRRESEREASAALLRVEMASAKDPRQRGPAASELQRVASEHAGTRAAVRAHILAAEALFRDGHFQEAKTEFDLVVGKAGDDSLAATAAFGAAASLEAMGKLDEALGAYQDVTLRHGTAGVASQARLALAGLHEQRGDAVQALRSYNELTNATASPWRGEALLRREALLARHPELATTNAAPGVSFPSVGGTNSLSGS